MAHNGGRFQTQQWFNYQGNQYLYINKFKTASYWELQAGGRPDAGQMSALGYPNVAGNYKTTVEDEGTTYRSGNRVLAWDGNATFTISGTTLQSGSFTSTGGTGGRAVFSLNSTTSPRSPHDSTALIVNMTTDGTASNLRWMHNLDESRYNSEKAANPSKEPFGTKAIQVLKDANPGVWRTLDMQEANNSPVALWSLRTPVNYFSFAVCHFPAAVYGGVLAVDGSSPAYKATVSGFVLQEGATVIFDIPGSLLVSGAPATLNVSGTGAKSMLLPSNSAWTRGTTTTTNRRQYFVYSAQLNAYYTFNDASLALANEFDGGLQGGVPPEVMIDLCNELNCHIHVVPPALTCDGPTDYMQKFAELARDNLNPGLQFRTEGGPNECWNGQFQGTIMARRYAFARWQLSSSPNNENEWYGRSVANIGNLVKTAFGGDRSRYAVMVGFQTGQVVDAVSGPNTSKRVEGNANQGTGGSSGANFATHIMFANYYNTNQALTLVTDTSTQNYFRVLAFVTKARLWFAGDAATQESVIDSLFSEADVNTWMNSALVDRLDRYTATANAYTVFGTSEKFKVTFYEGFYYPTDIASDPFHGIDNIAPHATDTTKTVATINLIGGQQAHAFVAGMAVRFRNVAGMTGMTGPYTVSSVTATTVTFNKDSTASGTFTTPNPGEFGYSLGSDLTKQGMIYDGYGNTGNQVAVKFSNASKLSKLTLYAAQKMLAKISEYPTCEFPADYFWIGQNNPWSKFNNLYSPDVSPQWEAAKLSSRRLRRHRLGAST